MAGPEAWRLWRRLYLSPLLAWLAGGVVLIFADRILEHPLRRQRELDLAGEVARACDALNRAGEDNAPILASLFFRHSPDDRLVASTGDEAIRLDTDRDSSLWLCSPEEFGREVARWRIEVPPRSPWSPRDAPTSYLLVGTGPEPASRLLWSRRAPEAAGYAAPLRRGLFTAWLLFGVLLIVTGVRGVRRVRSGVATLSRLVREEATPGAPPSPPEEATHEADEDVFDLAHALERRRRHFETELARHRQDERARARLLEEMPEGLIAVDANGRLQLINRAACALLDVDPDAPRDGRLVEVVRNSDLHRFVTGRFAGGASTADLDVGGGRRILLVRGNLMASPDGRPEGLVLILSDVTDRRRLEQIRKEFVDNVSHELKTPLTNLRGYVETLLDGAHEDPDSRVSFLRTVHRNAERMHRIVEDLLNLSRIESQGRQIERQPIRLGELLARVEEETRPEAAARQVRLRMEDETGNATYSGNLFMLERALSNLVDNAVKYGGAGKEVTLRSRRDGFRLRLEVSDQGPGIPPAHLGRLFERFYRVDRGRSRELGGTGLGLAIVKHVALAHGGEAIVTSEVGSGSTFALVLPWETERP